MDTKNEYIINAKIVVKSTSKDSAKIAYEFLLCSNMEFISLEKSKILSITDKNNELTEERIIKDVSNYTSIGRKLMETRHRKHETVRARYIVFVELMRLFGYTLSEAGAVFNYDHATAHRAKKLLNGDDYSLTKYYNKYLQTKNI